ncbi:MAG: TetR/AcrR family transcriptional regulator [Alphaproteobacteria bacterium]|nr:TetR/AcrR family transcriptional regulator [Alphaproteobacteria bacterium]MBV9419840.1 TetR/AcrR family transcriptional regulator [Alphaproteobacteria bacterium]MBV9541602.1 TetR/AcrR family transcriptional regulator [Alphaproteobacteria bacterium]
MAEKDTVRDQIVEAAKKRFSHFGYAKTTMAEVASDCQMSPGNLYRFFPGKLDIAEAIATEDYSKHLDHLRKLAIQPNKDARQRLHDLLFEELKRTYHKLEKDPRAYEMARVISQERPKFANWMLENERKILVELLEEAERRGEFTMEDKEFTAEMVQAATMKFRYPQLWSKLTLPKLERELEGVMNLLIQGLCPHMKEAGLARPAHAAE